MCSFIAHRDTVARTALNQRRCYTILHGTFEIFVSTRIRYNMEEKTENALTLTSRELSRFSCWDVIRARRNGGSGRSMRTPTSAFYYFFSFFFMRARMLYFCCGHRPVVHNGPTVPLLGEHKDHNTNQPASPHVKSRQFGRIRRGRKSAYGADVKFITSKRYTTHHRKYTQGG
jgi:hypothetical protein